MANKRKIRTESGTTTDAAAVKNIETINRFSKTEYIAVNLFCMMLFVVFGYIGIMSIFQTSIIDPASYANEVIFFQDDNIVLNLLCMGLLTALLFRINKHTKFFEKVDMWFMEIGLFVFVAVTGFIWIFAVTSIPAADSYNIFETATQAVDGIYTSFFNYTDFYNSAFYDGISYYNCYPFQLGFVFISEIIYRIFGTDNSMPVQIVNVLCVAAGYLAVAKITKLTFERKKIEFIAIIFLAVCIQPILLCSFAYGNIIGMCCALWASYFLIKYFKTLKYIYMLPCAVLLTVSTLAKYNNMIYLVAFAIMLLIHTVKTRKWQSVAFILALCIATAGSSNLVIMSYEKRAGTQLEDGVSQVLYLDMGLNESYMAPGWYNGIALQLYKDNNCNLDIAEQQAWAQIDARLDTFGNDLNYTFDFFGKKILSQWNETTYESIWVSEVKGHETEVDFIGNAVYNGSFGQFLELHFNMYMQVLFLLFAGGVFLLFANRKSDIATVLLPLVILGGFGYHLLFEGKSQYILTYIPLLIPVASYALFCLLDGKYVKIKEYIEKLKTIPEGRKISNTTEETA